MRLFGLAVALITLSSTPQDPPQRKVLALKGARIFTVSGAVIDAGTILIEGRMITAVAKDAVIPADATIIDCAGKVIIPGLIDVCSTLYVGEGDAAGGAEHDAYDALNPFDDRWKDIVAAGVTSLYVNPPNRGVAGGLGCIVRLSGTTDPAKLVARRGAALKFTLGVGQGESSAPQQRYQDYRAIKSMFEGATQYRESITKYQKDLAEYELKKRQWDEQQKTPPKTDPPKVDPPKPDPPKSEPPKLTEEPKKPRKPGIDRRNEALARALDGAGQLPVRIEAHTADCIEYALKLAEEFKLKVIVEQGTEAGLVADALAKAKVPVLVGPLILYGVKRVEYLGHTTATAALLSKAGVEFAIGTFPTARAGHGGAGSSRFLLDAAAIAAAKGLTRDQALKAVTLDAAKLLGMQASVGSIEPGKRADLVILNGDPFDADARVERVLVDGDTLFQRKD